LVDGIHLDGHDVKAAVDIKKHDDRFELVEDTRDSEVGLGECVLTDDMSQANS